MRPAENVKQEGTMKAEMLRLGAWHVAIGVRHALCSDGQRRYARITGEADTFFSIPAQVKVRGKTVSGYITGREYDPERGDYSQDYAFIAYEYGKNGHLLPGIVS